MLTWDEGFIFPSDSSQTASAACSGNSKPDWKPDSCSGNKRSGIWRRTRCVEDARCTNLFAFLTPCICAQWSTHWLQTASLAPDEVTNCQCAKMKSLLQCVIIQRKIPIPIPESGIGTDSYHQIPSQYLPLRSELLSCVSCFVKYFTIFKFLLNKFDPCNFMHFLILKPAI